MPIKNVLTVHPGEFLRTEIVAPHNLSVTQLADHLQVTRQAVSALLNGHAGLSAKMAVRFEQAFGISAATLVRMQAAYDLANARNARTVHIARLIAA